jgi:hypothetical protein
MTFDLIFRAKMTLGGVRLWSRKQNALNHFCGNHCGKESPAKLQMSRGPLAHSPVSVFRSARKYLYCLHITDCSQACEGPGSARGVSIRGLGNLHRFEAFCSLRVTLIGICISANESLRDRVLHTLIVVTRFIDSLQPKAYSDFDQRHWRQAEVLP